MSTIRRHICIAGLSLVLLCAVGPVFERAAAAEPFTFPDLLELLQQKLPTPRILDILATKCLTFLVDSAAVHDLRVAGADDSLLAGLHSVCNPKQELMDTMAELHRTQHTIDSLDYEIRLLSDSLIARRQKVLDDSLRAGAVRAKQREEAEADSAMRTELEQKEGARGAAKIYAARGDKYAAAGNFELAEREYRSAIRVTRPDPKGGGSEKDFKVYELQLGKLLFDQSKWDLAIEEFNQSITVSDSWDAYYYIGSCWMQQGSKDRAGRAAQRSLELAGDSGQRQKTNDLLQQIGGKP